MKLKQLDEYKPTHNHKIQDMKIVKKSFSIAFVLIGSIVGAGFATGKEIINFFGIYNHIAPYLIVVAGILIFCGLFAFFAAGKHSENKFIIYFFDILIFISEFVLFTTMISGLFSITNIFLSSDFLVYAILCVSYIIIVSGINGLSLANKILTPLLIIAVFILTIWKISFSNSSSILITDTSIFKKLSYPFLYFGLNIFTTFPLCKTFGKDMSKKEMLLTSLIVAILLTISILLIYFAIILAPSEIFFVEMPLAMLACSISSFFGIFYLIIIVVAITTTLLSCGVVLSLYGKNITKNNYGFCLSIMVLSLLLSRLGFSTIISIFYPIIGIFGLILFAYIVYNNTKKRPQIGRSLQNIN